MRRLIAGNWKMNGLLADATRIVEPLRALPADLACEVAVFPPATMLRAVAEAAAGSVVQVGGQDCRAEARGAHTGDVSAPQLRDAGAAWVILGHSERRADHGETDDRVRAKVLAAVAAGLTPIVCVGETADQRSASDQTAVVGWQIAGSLPKDFAGVVAYEPVWAIGTGRVARADEIAAMHAFIRAELCRELGERGGAIRILYGGSVKPANCAELLGIAEVAGALVGGASLDPAEFLAIVEAAAALCIPAAQG